MIDRIEHQDRNIATNNLLSNILRNVNYRYTDYEPIFETLSKGVIVLLSVCIQN